MFASLIRRKSGLALEASSEAAFESTTVSLSTAVPRPSRAPHRRAGVGHAARRQADRRFGRAAAGQGQEPFGGRLDGDCRRRPRDRASTSISSCRRRRSRLPSSGLREDVVGLKFDQNVDLGELLAGRKPRHGFRAAPAAAADPVQGIGPRRQGLLQRRRARHFAGRDEGRADRGILRRQEGRSWSSRACGRSRAKCAGIRIAAPASSSTSRSISTSLPNGSANGSSSPASRRVTKN